MEIRQLFPLGKAYGAAFCNREIETRRLIDNIKSCKHTLIIAPRRYGKSSLAERAIEKSGLSSEKVNFHLCTSEKEVAEIIIDNVIKLIGKSIGPYEKLITSIKKYLTNLEPLISFGSAVANLKLEPKNKVNYAVMITEALLLLDKLLTEKKKKAVFFLDEFQEIDRIGEHYVIEGAFRTAAQEMQSLSLIFSGSIRSLLLSMFEDENRPFYKLCRKIKLDRIEAAEYEKHIQKIALNSWKKKLEKNTFDRFMELTNRHPYYVNYLADTVWERCKKLPTLLDIEMAWQTVISEEWSDALRELSDLPRGQRRFLQYIANNNVIHIQGQETCSALSMVPSSLATVAHALIEKDYIEQSSQDGVYRVINPLLQAVLRGAMD